jgi:hypothetical protein
MSHGIAARARRAGRRSNRWFRPALERLESRTLPAGHTLLGAAAPVFGPLATAQVAGYLAASNQDDLYRVHLDGGDRLSAAIHAQYAGSALQSLLRVFSTTGQELALNNQEGGDGSLGFQAAQPGNYFVGVSSAGNAGYDPTRANSGAGGTSSGLYTLDLRVQTGQPMQADLTGASFRLATAAWGESISGTFRVDNRGAADSSGFTVSLVLSSGTRFDGFDPSVTLPAVLASGPPALLAAGHAYTDQFTVQLPSRARASFSASSGPVYVGLLLTPNDPTKDRGLFDKSGVHRGADWETVTIVTPVPQGVTVLSSVDANLNTRVSGMLPDPAGVDTYEFAMRPSGRFSVQVTATAGSTLVPRLTLLGPHGHMLIQSDDGAIVQHLVGEVYTLIVSARSGTGSYQLTSEFVPANPTLDQVAIGNSPGSVAVGDFNGDGIPDLVTANNFDNTVSVLLGNGDGTFASPKTLAVGNYPVSVAVGDFTGDGKLDIAVANQNDGTVSVLLGNGDGTFETQKTVPVGTSLSALAVADVNGDGKADIIVSANTFGDTVSVLLSNGDGTFTPDPSSSPGLPLGTFAVGNGPEALAVADLNGDGLPDIITANYLDDTVSVLLNNGNGTFQTQQTFATGYRPSAVAVGDVNGDGIPDLVVPNQGSRSAPANTVSVLLGNGDGTFAPPENVVVSLPLSNVAVADVNGDGKSDIIFTSFSANTVGVLLSNGDGSFRSLQRFTVRGLSRVPGAVAVADFDGDGRLDLVTSDASSGSVSVLPGNGDGTFQTLPTFAVGSAPVAVAVADVNGDGKPDIVTANSLDRTVTVQLSNGDGTFQPSQTFAVGFRPVAVAVADVNGDGKPDIVAVNSFDNTVSVLLGKGDGTFTPDPFSSPGLPPGTFAVGALPTAVAVADIDGDGDPDLVVTNTDDGTVTVLLGKGDGSFHYRNDDPTQGTFPVGPTPGSVAVGDLGNGKLDLVVAHSDGDSVSVLLGDGHGGFTPGQTIVTGRAPFSVALADVDGDHKLDLVVANLWDNTLAVLLGNGDGTFHFRNNDPTQGTYPVIDFPNSVAVADVDGDGKPDLVTTNIFDNSVSLLRGNGDGTFRSQQRIGVGISPESLAVADVNGDGIPDLVTANLYDNTTSVLLGDGKGNFTPTSSASGVGARNTPVLANLDSDALPDAVVLDRFGNILFRQGLTVGGDSFAPPVPINDSIRNLQTGLLEERTARDLAGLHTATGSVIASADASADPNVLASTHQFVYSVSLYSAAGGGKFARTTAFTTSLLPTRIVAGDLSDPIGVNGPDDIVVADALDNSIQVSFQQAGGTFSTPVTLATGGAPGDVAFVDVDGDGLRDIVVTNQTSGDVSVFLNDKAHSFARSYRFRAGTGLFGLSGQDSLSLPLEVSSPAQPVSLTSGAFTGNGRNDLVVVERGAHSFSVLGNDGSGFANPQAALTTSTSDGLDVNNQPGPVVAGTFHGAAKPLDLAVLMEDRAEVWIYSNDGHGHFTHTFSIAAGAQPTGLSIVPNASTGNSDLLVGNVFGDVLRLQGNGDGTFRAPTGKRSALAVLNVGGQDQVLLANQAANHVVVESAVPGSNTFVPTQTVAAVAATPTTPFAPGDVHWYFLDQNSATPDAVVLASAGNRLQTYRFDPVSGSYVKTNDIAVGDNPVSVSIATLPGTSAPDLFVVNKGSNDVSVILGSIVNGQWVGTPGPRLKSGGSGPLSAFVVADANGQDGTGLEVVNQDGTVALLPSRGQGFFNDVNPPTVALGAAVTAAPVFLDGLGILPTAAGGLVAFQPDTLTSLGQVLAPAGVVAAAAGPDGELLVVEAGGAVEELAFADGQFHVVEGLEPLDGIPSEPSALAILETASGLRALVSEAGSDTLFAYDFGVPVGLPPLPQAVVESGATPLPSAPLVVVITSLSSGLPEGSSEGEATAGTPGNPPASTPVGDPGSSKPAFAASGGEGATVTAGEVVVGVFEGPDAQETLRHLRLFRPTDDDMIVPPGTNMQSQLSGAGLDIASLDPSTTRPGSEDSALVFQDQSWLVRRMLDQPRLSPASGEVREVPVAVRAEPVLAVGERPARAKGAEEGGSSGDAGEQPAGGLRQFGRQALVVLGAVVLSWSPGVRERRAGRKPWKTGEMG